MLVYGVHGSGKTTLAGSSVDVEKMRDVLIISADKGEMVVHDNDRIKKPDLIDTIPMTNYKQLSSVREWLVAHCHFRDNNNEKGLRDIQNQIWDPADPSSARLRRFRTVVIDTLTELDAYSMNELLNVTENHPLHGDMPSAEFKEYKQNHMKMHLLVRAFRDLPMHVICLVQRAYEQDELKKYKFSPALTGKLAGQVQGFFDVVGFLAAAQATEEGGAQRRLYVQPIGGQFDAKNRRANLKRAYFDDPTMTAIMKEMSLA